MNPDTRRWVILVAGILANICQGAAYASSIFAAPILQHLGAMMSSPEGRMVPDMTKWALAFSLQLAMLPVGMLLFGKIADQKGPRIAVIIGGLLFGTGIFLSGCGSTLTQFYLTFGVMPGLGSGAAYGAIVATSVRWFPDRRGLASGLVVGALGFGPVVIVGIGEALMKMGGADGVLFAFKVLGVAFLLIMCGAGLLMTNPPAGYAPANYQPKAAAKGAAPAGVDYNWIQMLGKGRFWLLYLLYVCGAFSGLMIISQAKTIAMGMPNSGLEGNALKTFAATTVAYLAIANASGRVIWAAVSDRLGRLQSVALMFVMTCVGMFLLPELAKSSATIVLGFAIVGIAFGGYLGTFPSLCADAFGPKNMGINYALLFSAFAVAAIAGPYVGGQIKNTTGNYDQAFMIATVVGVVGLIVSLFMLRYQPSEKKAA